MIIAEFLEKLKKLSEKERQELFSHFCRICSILLENDWVGDCCDGCSPDPQSDR